MHMLSKKDVNAVELENVRTSSNATTVFAASGEVKTNEEATMYVKDLDLVVTVQRLEKTPPVLSLGQLCEDHGYSCESTGGQKPHLIKNGRKIHAIPRTTCQLLSQVFRADPQDPVRYFRLLHLHHRTQRDRNQRRDQEEEVQQRNRMSARGNSQHSAEEKQGDNSAHCNLGQALPE